MGIYDYDVTWRHLRLAVISHVSIHAPLLRGATWLWCHVPLAQTHFNPRTHVGCDTTSPFQSPNAWTFISIHAPIKYEYGSTFLYYCGLIGSHAVPIAHSVLSGLDNGPLFERERSRVWCATEVHHIKTSYPYYITVLTGMQAKTDL